MARYDRIAPLSAPPREAVFPGWLVLRDLEGRDRDADLARRARLRYLAIRPVRRMLDRGPAALSLDSYMAEIEAARQDLGYLPARDVERARLTRFLHQIEQRDAVTVITALLEIAEACSAAGQTFGAEEYALTAHGLAVSAGEYRLEGVANTVRARIARSRAQWAEADVCAHEADAIARRVENASDIVRARAELAFNAAAQGDAATARTVLQHTVAEMHSAHDEQAEALANSKLCAAEIMLGNPAAALECAPQALRNLSEPRERSTLFEQIGAAFSAAGLHKVAERCMAIAGQRSPDASVRARIRAAQTVQVAALGADKVFHERRAALLNDATEWAADPRATASVHLELGRGCVLVHDTDFAREHLRSSITTARKHNLSDILASAEAVLTALETNSADGLVATATDPATVSAARSIAEQLEALPEFSLVPA